MFDIDHYRRCERLDNINRSAYIAKIGLKVGDFVKFRTGTSIWFKVEKVWLPDALSVSNYASWGGYSFTHNISLIHRANDPWDFGEVQYIADDEGVYGNKHPPVPEKYQYQGPLEVVAWAWKYRQYAYIPGPTPAFKNPVREAQFRSLKLQDFTNKSIKNLTSAEASALRLKLEASKNADGWRPCVEFKPLEVYNKTIKIGEVYDSVQKQHGSSKRGSGSRSG